MAGPQIDLTGGRIAARKLLRRLVPSRIRLALSIYDRKTHRYVQIPGYKGAIPVATKGEVVKLWRAIREAVESQTWRVHADDDHDDLDGDEEDPSADLGDWDPGAGDSVVTKSGR
jgi:hypothetical protein